MKRIVLAVAVAGVVVATLFVHSRRSQPPQAEAARVTRATLVQVLTTNGKVEALDGVAVTVRAPSLIAEVLVQEGDPVRKGQALATVDQTAAREALERVRAQLEIARADRALVERGGGTVSLADIEAALARARLDQELSERELAALQRLVERQAATRAELAHEQEKLRKIRTEQEALERRRQALVAPEDRVRVTARIREAEAAVAQAQTALAQLDLRSPAEGIVYTLELRPGRLYQAGDVAAEVGRLDRVRVRVLVDEPELGRVAVGQQVVLHWDALPGEAWQGTVERLPSQIETVGTRTVGEVWCTVQNPRRRLLPHVTVNVEIRTGRAENALAIPREAVVREARQTFVLVVDGAGAVARRPVKLGIQDPTRVEVVEGLRDGEVVLLPGERAVQLGEKVQPKVGT